MMPSPYADVTSSIELPRIIRIAPNLYVAAFSLMKLVPARFILDRAHRDGKLGPDTRIVETTSGTFGLALAMQAALIGRPLTLVSDPVIEADLARRLTDLGAELDIVTVPSPDGGIQAARLDRVEELRNALPDTFCPEQYRNPDNPAAYMGVAEHLIDRLGSIDCLVGPVGSGGSMCGTVTALRGLSGDHVKAVAVDTHGSVLFGHQDRPRGLRGLGNSLMPQNLDHTVFDEVHWCGPRQAYAATRWAHRKHALFHGPTSGAAILVARWWAQTHPDQICVAMLPDDGHRYLTTVYNDSWLATQNLTDLTMPERPTEVAVPQDQGDGWTRMVWGRKVLEKKADR